MSDFHAAYPDYAATARLDELRGAEYSYLDAGGHTYLDYPAPGWPRTPSCGRTPSGCGPAASATRTRTTRPRARPPG